ncbi:MAG: efflux RND transporter periplasmic adaptor subunit [Nitrospinae bacterium]|nr:efflux RND transporter periplasmic adaptor subunit [Nitrospinota bacterium]
MKNIRLILSGFIPSKKAGFSAFVAVAAVIAVSCSKGGQEGRQKKFGAAPVRVAKGELRDVPNTIEVVGNVEAYLTLSVTSQVNGQIDKIHFKEGDFVHVGNPLVTIDPRPFKAALAQAEANSNRDAAQMKNAQREEARYKELVKKGYVSQSQYDQAAATADALAASVAADKAAEDTARLNLDYCYIRSPIDGKTGPVMIYAGNYVKANDKTIVTVLQVRPIYAEFSVPQLYLPTIRKYMAEGKLEVDAFPPAGLPPVKGSVSFIDNAVDPTTGTLKLKATFENAESALWPGQFVKVSLLLTTDKGVVVVPTQAVMNTQKGSSVYVVKPDGTAELRPVKISRSVGPDSIVENGLGAGETVVTDGQLQAMPGGKVRIIEDQPGKKEPGK